jgi:hypothetical protein
MSKKLCGVFAVLCAIAVSAVCASAQAPEVKEKPRMYTYVAFWNLPRAQWPEEDKLVASEQKLMDKSVADGLLIGYGSDKALVHQADGATHDTWFSAMSMAGLLNTLDEVYKSGGAMSPVQVAATKHWDGIYVTRYYNWHPGSFKDVYSEASMYTFKPDAPDGALDLLSKNLFVPLMEKLLADGTIHEYEIDTEAIHAEAPGTFWIDYIGANAEAVDKVSAAVREAVKASPLSAPTFDSVVDYSKHRDYLVRTTATYK